MNVIVRDKQDYHHQTTERMSRFLEQPAWSAARSSRSPAASWRPRSTIPVWPGRRRHAAQAGNLLHAPVRARLRRDHGEQPLARGRRSQRPGRRGDAKPLQPIPSVDLPCAAARQCHRAHAFTARLRAFDDRAAARGVAHGHIAVPRGLRVAADLARNADRRRRGTHHLGSASATSAPSCSPITASSPLAPPWRRPRRWRSSSSARPRFSSWR